MMEWSTAWLLDGDLCRCRKCKRGIVMSRSAESFIHASGCSQAHLDSPWRDLQALFTPPPSTEPAPQSVRDGHEPWGHDLWKHLHDEHGLMLLESELQQIVRKSVPLVSDLSQVVVLDKKVVEEIECFMSDISLTFDGSILGDRADNALASLNAGGANE